MTDQRPQYGELATPEEQRAAAGLPPIDHTPPPAGPVGPPIAPGTSRPQDADTTPRRHPVDRLVTIALLAYGLVNVVVTGLSYLDLASVMNQSMEILGIDGEFTNFAQGRLWGTVAAAVLAIGWALTAMLSLRRLRRGRITWWLPLVGAVVTMFVVSICISVPMLGDPAFVEHLNGLSGG